jgi:AcrR family transcriptional regulator
VTSIGQLSAALTDQAGAPGRDIAETRRDQIVLAAIELFSKKGYFQTTIEDIASTARVSKGLVYLYFTDKLDVLFYTLRYVLEFYGRELPALLKDIEHPLQRLDTALRTYCGLIDKHRDETVLAYQSTKILPDDQRAVVKAAEFKINRIIQDCMEDCIYQGLMQRVNLDFLVHQFAAFCHSWALKHWAFRDKYTLDEYVEGGIGLLIDPHLTEKGRAEKQALAEAEGRARSA